MEITGLKCSHKDCPAREWADSDAALDWVPTTITRPRDGVHKLVHYCPQHGAGLIDNTDFSDERLTTGQQRIVCPPAVSVGQRVEHPAYDIVEEMDRANDADLARAGVTAMARATQATDVVVIPDVPWGPPSGPPTPANGEATALVAAAIAITDGHPSAENPHVASRGPRRVGSGRTKRTPDGIARAQGIAKAKGVLIGLLMLTAGTFASSRGVR